MNKVNLKFTSVHTDKIMYALSHIFDGYDVCDKRNVVFRIKVSRHDFFSC